MSLHDLYDNFKDAVLRQDELTAEKLIADPALPVNGFKREGSKGLIFWAIDYAQKNIMQMQVHHKRILVN